MGTLFSPTRQDVERYQQLRAANVKLSQRILETVPKKAWDDIGDAIGILRDGVLVFDSEDMVGVLGDCLLYNWFQNGKNVVQLFASTHVMNSGSDEDVVLRACLSAKYRILKVQSALPGAGIYCQDLLSGFELFLMDVGMSKTATKGYSVATRTLPIDEYWVTGGAGLPIDKETPIDEARRQLERDYPDLVEAPDGMALPIVRACLAAGAGDRVRYEGAGTRPMKPRRIGHLPPKKPRYR